MPRRIAAHIRFLVGASRGIGVWRSGLASGWTSSAADRLRLHAVALAARLRLLRVPVPVPRIALTIDGRRTLARIGGHHELAAAYEVLCEPDYHPDLGGREVRRVLDIGANVGFATLLFASRFPGAEVVALEPAPDTFARLRENLAGVPNARAMHLAAGAPGQITFDLSVPTSERRGQSGSGATAVRRVSLGELLDLLGWDDVDLVKVDIEGDEFELLAEADATQRTAVIVGELHAAAAPEGFRSLAPLLPHHDVLHADLRGRTWVMFSAVRRDA